MKFAAAMVAVLRACRSLLKFLAASQLKKFALHSSQSLGGLTLYEGSGVASSTSLLGTSLLNCSLVQLASVGPVAVNEGRVGVFVVLWCLGC
jgi:hypothetical protein